MNPVAQDSNGASAVVGLAADAVRNGETKLAQAQEMVAAADDKSEIVLLAEELKDVRTRMRAVAERIKPSA